VKYLDLQRGDFNCFTTGREEGPLIGLFTLQKVPLSHMSWPYLCINTHKKLTPVLRSCKLLTRQ